MPLERQAMLSAEGLKSLGFSCAQASAGNSIRAGNVEKIPLPVGSLIQGGLLPLGALSGGGEDFDPKPGRGDSLASAGRAPARSRKPRAVAENKAAVMAFRRFTNKPACPVSCEASRNMDQMVLRLSFRDRVKMSEVAGGIETAGERAGDLLSQGEGRGHWHSRSVP